MARKCTCINCKAEDFVRGLYPKLDDRWVLHVAADIVKTMRASVSEIRRDCDDVGGGQQP